MEEELIKIRKSKKIWKNLMWSQIIIFIIISIMTCWSIIDSNNSNDSCTNTHTYDDYLAIQQFNSRFEAYLGSFVTGSNVKALVNAICNNNRHDSLQVSINGKKWNLNTEDDVFKVSTYKAGYVYTVESEYNEAGYIENINIKKNDNRNSNETED